MKNCDKKLHKLLLYDHCNDFFEPKRVICSAQKVLYTWHLRASLFGSVNSDQETGRSTHTFQSIIDKKLEKIWNIVI